MSSKPETPLAPLLARPEVERLGYVAMGAYYAEGTVFTPSIQRWVAAVRAVLSDPAVAAAVLGGSSGASSSSR
jgi:hypothetical protein